MIENFCVCVLRYLRYTRHGLLTREVSELSLTDFVEIWYSDSMAKNKVYMDSSLFYGTKRVLVPNGDESEDENLSDDDSPQNFNCKVHVPRSFEKPLNLEEEQWDSEDDLPLINILVRRNNTRRDRKNIQWSEAFLNVPAESTLFNGNQDLPEEIINMEEPYDFFKYLLTTEMVKYITEESNLYSVQCRPEKPANITPQEICGFLGISIYMSIIQLPSTRSYWKSSMAIPAICDVMSCNRFEEIKKFLHFNDNNNQVNQGERHDKLYKIRPFLSKVRERLLTIPKEEHMAVDEQIIPTKARSHLKQYNPKKPHKWGYKVFVLSGVSGFSYDFDIYAGATELPPNQPDLGMSSNVVVSSVIDFLKLNLKNHAVRGYKGWKSGRNIQC
ncbi:piggyBac transposable element-derived protein 3-like [Onthophagus taurus]|uniref:piggyBac transposable element-derived protein 3-like n=1 Tax=Onthophagus taurus TaxID=166361 RepID=UPI0039BDFEB9